MPIDLVLVICDGCSPLETGCRLTDRHRMVINTACFGGKYRQYASPAIVQKTIVSKP